MQERFLDPAVMRHVMVDGAVRRIGGALDIDQMAPELINIIVPHFCNAAGLVVLESLVGDEDEFPSESLDGTELVRRLAVAHDGRRRRLGRRVPDRRDPALPAGHALHRVHGLGLPVCVVMSRDNAESDGGRAWIRQPVAELLSGDVDAAAAARRAGRHARLLRSASARSGTGGSMPTTSRSGMEFASRAAIFMDNAQRYSRERATALTLQRSMLPTGLSAPSSVEVKHRYLPGSKLIEVGGDWYESIALPGGRVALVVGDVAGHGVRAAVTMGRLRTAIHTLAMLELPPAETLQQLNELMQELGVREPHFATCVYAIFDAVSGTCEVASAGHLPPLLVRPDGTNELLDVYPAPPLGVGYRPDPEPDAHHRGRQPARAVHRRPGGEAHRGHRRGPDPAARDLRTRIDRPAARGSVPATLAGVYADEHRDDIAVLIARLRRIPAGSRRELDAAVRADLGQPGPVADPAAAAAVGPRLSCCRPPSCWSPSWSPTPSGTHRARSGSG